MSCSKRAAAERIAFRFLEKYFQKVKKSIKDITEETEWAHPIFGYMIWMDTLNCWVGELVTSWGRIPLYFRAPRAFRTSAKAKSIFNGMLTSEHKISLMGAEDLVEEYNEKWRKKGPPLSVKELANLWKLSHVVVYSDGKGELWYAGTFGGSQVRIRIQNPMRYLGAEIV